MKIWKCNDCGSEFDRVQISWGMSGGEKVDILDYFCPHCLNDKPEFKGTKEQHDAYWKMEWNTP